VNVQVKVVAAPAANVAAPPVHVVQPVPVTETPVIVALPVLVSVTVIVMSVRYAAVGPGATLVVVSVVDAVIAVTVPLVVSFVAETALPRASVPWPVAVHAVVEFAVNVHVKSADAPAASVAAPPLHVVQPVPVTETAVIVESPVLASVTMIVNDV